MQDEKAVETRLKDRIKNLGGLCIKWVSPGMTGLPDRVIILKGKVYFVELKDPKGVSSARQLLVARQFKEVGVEVVVLSSIQEVEDFIERLDDGIATTV